MTSAFSWQNSISLCPASFHIPKPNMPVTSGAKFRLKLKKVGETTRPLRYDPNQIPYDYTAEMRNRFKGLDLIDRMPDELWTEVHDIKQETGIKTILKKKKCKTAKWLSGEALQIAVKRREAKRKGGMLRYTYLNAVSKNSKEKYESLPQRSMQRNRGKE